MNADLVWVCTRNWMVSPDYRRGCLRGPQQEKIGGYWQYQDHGGAKAGHEDCGWFRREGTGS